MSKETDNSLDSYIENASEPAPGLDGEVRNKQETQEIDVKIDDVPNSSGELEDGGKVVEKIKKQVLEGKKVSDTGVDTEKDKDSEEEGTDIPDEFTNACLKAGWTEEEIREFAAELDDKVLIDLIPEILDEELDEQELAEGQATQEEKPKPPATTTKTKPENEELASLKKELEAIKEELGEARKIKAAREQDAMLDTANHAFDEAGEEFEIFGKTKELLTYPAGPKKGQYVPTSPAMIARNEVWNKALPFVQSGVPVREAMDIALTWYKGKHLEKDIHRNVIKDLKKHETKLSAKRTGKETVKVYENEDERKADVVREAARRAGVKGKYDVD